MTQDINKPKPAAPRLSERQIVTVKIEGIGSRGEGIARLDDEEIYIPKTAIGDECEIRLKAKKKGRWIAELLKVLSPSPTRRDPACQHFSECGGCDFQHLPYKEQVAWKVRMTKHWIRRSPLEPFLKKLEIDTLEAPSEFGYRHRVRLQIRDHKIHFFKPHSHELLEIRECPILVKGFWDRLESSAQEIAQFRDWNQSAFRSYTIRGHQLDFDEECFTQGNAAMNELMVNRVFEDIEEVPKRTNALDLYCGIGNFSIPMKDDFENVTGVEMEGASIRWARKNSDRIEWLAGSCDDVVPELVAQKRRFDYILLDPPRAGALTIVPYLDKLEPLALTYVSCNLESLIKDLTFLVKKSSFRVKRWTMADLFPQTHHIESIVSLVRK